jgi:hypothetical protein
MSKESQTARPKITAYQLFGFIPLLITMAGAGAVVLFSIIRDL